MSEGRGSAGMILLLIIAASGLGLAGYNTYQAQTQLVASAPGEDGEDGNDGVDGDSGNDGSDGMDGEDAPGGIQVGILDPDMEETLSGNVSIRALVFGSADYTVSVMRNGTEIGNSIPLVWNTTQETDGWWNITVRVNDVASGNETEDQVLVYVKNKDTTTPRVTIYNPNENEIVWGNITIKALIEEESDYSVQVLINGSLNATYVPFVWNASKFEQGCWNISVLAIDIDGNIGQDTIIVRVQNVSTPRARAYVASDYVIATGYSVINFTAESYDTHECFDLDTDNFTVPETGYYSITFRVEVWVETGAYLYVSLMDQLTTLREVRGTNSYRGLYEEFIDTTMVFISDVLYLEAGAQIWLLIYVNGNGVPPEPCTVFADDTYLTIVKID